jgi:hypothetical protein
LVQDGVEVFHRQGKEVAVGLGPNTGHSSGVCQQADLTEIGPVAERCGHIAVAHHNVHNSLLDKVHFRSDGALLDDDIT